VLHVFRDVRDLRHCIRSEIEWGTAARPRGEIVPPPSIREGCRWIEEVVEDVQVVGRCGDPAEEILDEALLHAHPLIVMASLGSTGFRRVLMGSVTTAIVRSAMFPVVVIPSRSAKADFAEPAIERMAILVERSADALADAPLTVSIATALRIPVAIVELVNARSVESNDPPQSLEDVHDAVREGVTVDRDTVQATRGEIDDTNVDIVRVAYGDDPLAVIARYVHEWTIGLIVVSTRPRSFLERLTYPSISDEVAGALPAPVLVVPVGSDDRATG
jgi:nucleotide-binding universal stress UspA family protein